MLANISGISIPMNIDSGSEAGSLSNITTTKLNVGRFPKLGTEKMTKGKITKTIITYNVPLTIGNINTVAPMNVGVDSKSDLVYDVFPLEFLIENSHKIEMSDTTLKVITPGLDKVH
jgi:hypothetical protein